MTLPLNFAEPEAIHTPCDSCGPDARRVPQGACWRDLDARRVCLFCVHRRRTRAGDLTCAQFSRYVRDHFTCPHFTCETP